MVCQLIDEVASNIFKLARKLKCDINGDVVVYKHQAYYVNILHDIITCVDNHMTENTRDLFEKRQEEKLNENTTTNNSDT